MRAQQKVPLRRSWMATLERNPLLRGNWWWEPVECWKWKSNLLEARGNPSFWIWIFPRQFKIQPPCDDHCWANSDKKRWLHGGWHATMIQHQRSTSLSCSLNYNCSSIKEVDHKGWQRSSMSWSWLKMVFDSRSNLWLQMVFDSV